MPTFFNGNIQKFPTTVGLCNPDRKKGVRERRHSSRGFRVSDEEGDKDVPPPKEESGGVYILSRMASPKPEQRSLVTSSRPSRLMRRARS